MKNIRYRSNLRYDGPGGIYSDLSRWMEDQAEDNSETLERLKRNLREAITSELTPRQAELITMHFFEAKGVREIARELGVVPSTVSRTITRAKRKLHRSLKYSF